MWGEKLFRFKLPTAVTDPSRSARTTILRDQQGAQFERKKAYGCRLNIAAGTAVRFEPGQSRRAGCRLRKQKIYGFAGKVMSVLVKITRQRSGDVRPTLGDRAARRRSCGSRWKSSPSTARR
jgi:hypothetical protein